MKPYFKDKAVIAYAVLSIFISLVVLTIIACNWSMAYSSFQGKRLRWHVVAVTKIQQGNKLRANDLRRRFYWLPTLPHLADSRHAVEKYAEKDLYPDKPLDYSILSDVVAARPQPEMLYVPVDVNTEHARNLKIGMKLGFVRDNEMIPDLLSSGNQGYLLISINTSAQEPKITSLLVEVPRAKAKDLMKLGTNTWRPVLQGK